MKEKKCHQERAKTSKYDCFGCISYKVKKLTPLSVHRHLMAGFGGSQ